MLIENKQEFIIAAKKHKTIQFRELGNCKGDEREPERYSYK